MPVEFQYYPDPSPEICERLCKLSPENPFYAPEYLNARQALGAKPIVFALAVDDVFLTGCSAFSTRGRLNHKLEITSLPEIDDDGLFWDGVLRFCAETRVSILEVYSFHSRSTAIPMLRGETWRRDRYEYQLELLNADLWLGLHRRHRRQIVRARDTGLAIRRNRTTDVCIAHTDLANRSLSRRLDGNEETGPRIRIEDSIAFVSNNAGEIFQAELNGEVLSTLLILRSKRGSYAQTSGTTDKGRSLGASQFVFFETASILQQEGVDILNLGGTDIESKGLQDFKESFGAKRFELQAAEFYVGGLARRMLGKLSTDSETGEVRCEPLPEHNFGPRELG